MNEVLALARCGDRVATTGTPASGSGSSGVHCAAANSSSHDSVIAPPTFRESAETIAQAFGNESPTTA